MLHCPNKRLKAWKDLVAATGNENYSYYLWNKYEGVVPESEYKKYDSKKKVKPKKDESRKNKFKLSEVQYQNTTNQSDEDYIASEKTIRDLAERIADRIGLKVTYESDRTKDYKGKLEGNTAVINLAHATLDTPIHEILAHPIIRVIKNNKKLISEKTDYSKGYPQLGKIKETNQLYQNLLKELEYGRGKEVLDRVKRDYKYKSAKIVEQNRKQLESWKVDLVKNPNDKTAKLWVENLEKRIKEQEYTLEEQQEEAIVELLGLYTADRLDKVKDGKLISLLKRLLKEMKAYMRSLFNQKEVKIDELPDNMTLGDIADLLAYSNSKLILPGNEVVYTTPDNQTFKTYQEASNHISELIKLGEIDLDKVSFKVNKIPNEFVVYSEETYRIFKEDGTWYEHFMGEDPSQISEQQAQQEWEDSIKYAPINEGTNSKITPKNIQAFIEKNKEYEQSAEIIEEWKRINNIKYNPEEVYSRGQGFYSVVGAYSDFDVELMFQNLLAHIQDNKKAGGEFTISAFTKPINKNIGHLEGGGGKIKFKIFPKSEDIKWAANTDVYSGSVWDASEKVSKDTKSEIIGVSYTKSPSLNNINSVQPNLADIIDNLAHHHNELGIELTGNNFRLEYDDNVPYSTKKLIDKINSILDEKFGKLVEPKISKDFKDKNKYSVNYSDTGFSLGIFNTIEEAQEFIDKGEYDDFDDVYIETISSNEELKVKESINNVKNRLINERYDLDLKEYNQASQGIIPSNYSDYTDLNGKLKEKIRVFTLNVGNTSNKVGMWQNDEDYQVVKDYIVGEEKNQHGVKFWILSDEFKKEALSSYKNPTPQKEYISQAEINTKIAALKKGQRKFPRSLIRSEVRTSNSQVEDLFDENDLAFQKVSKQIHEEIKAQQEIITKDNTSRLYQLPKVKKGVDYVFQQNPQLAEIGSPEQYSTYLDSIFPNSKVKDIIYHGTRNEFNEFKKRDKEIYSLKNETQTNSLLDGIFFTDKDTALDNYTDDKKLLKSVIINMQIPFISDDRRLVSNKNISNEDGVITTEFIGDSISDIYVVFEPEQIHILGSKQDIDGFKKFINNPKAQLSNKSKKVNTELNNKLKDLLAKLGINIENFDAFQEKYGYDAVAVADMIDKVIRINEGRADETTLPEEAAHFIIELLGNHPLARRLQALVAQDEYYKIILDDEFEDYNETYKGNKALLIKEAAGKLLGQALISKFKGEVFNIPAQPMTLMQRLWNYFKGLFKKTNSKEYSDNIKSLYEETAGSFLEGKLEGLSLANINSNISLAQLTESSLKRLKTLSKEVRDRSAKRLEVYKAKNKKKFALREEEALNEIADAFEKADYMLSITKAMEHTNEMFLGVNKRLSDIIKQFSKLDTLDVREASKILRDMSTFRNSYIPILEDIQEELNILIDEDPENQHYKDTLQTLLDLLNIGKKLKDNYYKLSVPVFAKFLGKFVGNGPAKDLEAALKLAEKDITFAQRLFDSMAEANDPILQLIDVAVKNAKLEAMQNSYQIQKDLIQHKMDLEKAGIKTADFVYELDENGKPTGNLVGEYDSNKFWVEFYKYKDKLHRKSYQLDKGGTIIVPTNQEEQDKLFENNPKLHASWKSDWGKWYKLNKQPVKNAEEIIGTKRDTLPREDFDIWYNENVKVNSIGKIYYTGELSVPADKYRSKQWLDIQASPEKKKFYDFIIKTKEELDSKLPEQFASGRLAPQLRKDFIERVKDAHGFGDAAKVAKNELIDSLTITEDATEYGGKFKMTDEAGHPVNFLPIHFTKKLSDMSQLSTDIVASMSAYALMAEDYHAMNGIIDVLELGKDLVDSRQVIQRDSSGNIIKESIKVLKEKVEKTLTKEDRGSNVANRLNDYFDMVIYGKSRVEGKAINIPGLDVKLDSERLIDLVGKYTSMNGLAWNLFANIQNVITGSAMIRTEAFAKEFVSHGDLAAADIMFTKELPKAIAQIGSRMHTNMMDLWREHFNVQQDYNTRTREINAERKSLVSKAFKESSMYVGGAAGEYYLQIRMSFALAHALKLKLDGKEISLLEAYEVKGNRLSLKQNVTKLDGSAWTKQDERDFMMKQNSINNGLHGIYNDIDRSAIQKYAWGRLMLQFRKFMRSGYNRRWRDAKFNYERQVMTEGFHKTNLRFIGQLIGDLKRGQFLMMTHWDKLDPYQKRNMYRSLSEIGYILSGMFLASLMNGLKGVGDDDEWALNMTAYQLNRFVSEMGFFLDPRQTLIILNSPAAGISQVTKLIDFITLMFQPWEAFDTIERGRYKGVTRIGKLGRQVVPMWDTVSDWFYPQDKLIYFTLHK